MASYYKKINGLDYDKAILDMAKASVEGQGDGRISLNDAKKIVKLIQDGGKITPIEKRSLKYVLEKYKLTETAIEHIEKTLGAGSGIASKVKSAAKKEAAIVKKPAAVKKQIKEAGIPLADKAPAVKSQEILKAGTATEENSTWKYLLLALIAILLILGMFYLYSKYKKSPAGTQETFLKPAGEVKTESVQKPATENVTVTAEKPVEQVKTAVEPLSPNSYVIKEKDTLVKIAAEHYGDYRKWELIWKHNKGVLKSPILIFPGQVIELPEVK